MPSDTFPVYARPGPHSGSLQRTADLLAGSAGLTIVPVVPWRVPPPPGPPPTAVFYHAVSTSER